MATRMSAAASSDQDSGIFSMISNMFSPKEDPKVVESRKREINMQQVQIELAQLRSGVESFTVKKKKALKQMKNAKEAGNMYEAQNQYFLYLTCDDQIKKLNNIIKSLNGIEISMLSAKYSVGAQAIMQESSEFYQSIGKSINPDIIDRNISTVMDQETVISEMQDQLSLPFSKSSLEHNEKDDETVFASIDALINASNDDGRPRDRPRSEAIPDLPGIPEEVKKYPLKRKSKKVRGKTSIKSKAIF